MSEWMWQSSVCRTKDRSCECSRGSAGFSWGQGGKSSADHSSVGTAVTQIFWPQGTEFVLWFKAAAAATAESRTRRRDEKELLPARGSTEEQLLQRFKKKKKKKSRFKINRTTLHRLLIVWTKPLGNSKAVDIVDNNWRCLSCSISCFLTWHTD